MVCNFTTAENCCNQQFLSDIQIVCNFVVLFVCHRRDKHSHLHVLFHLIGNDKSKNGGMVGMERAYNFHELVSIANTLNRLSRIEYSENDL